MLKEPEPSFDPDVLFPWPDTSKRKVKIETEHEKAKLIGDKRHLPSNEPKKGGLSMIAARASTKKKDEKKKK